MSHHHLSLILLLLLLSACGHEPGSDAEPVGSDLSRDYFSHANSGQFVTRHLELDLAVDFEQQLLEGFVIHHMECLQPGAKEIVLDSRGLRIERVQLAAKAAAAMELPFELAEADPVRGEALRISLPADHACNGELELKIDYRTSPQASAIMWLPPELTAGGRQPFMFTQSQSIHARSWVPLQDTPAVRMTYEALIRTPPDLLAVMRTRRQRAMVSTIS